MQDHAGHRVTRGMLEFAIEVEEYLGETLRAGVMERLAIRLAEEDRS